MYFVVYLNEWLIIAWIFFWRTFQFINSEGLSLIFTLWGKLQVFNKLTVELPWLGKTTVCRHLMGDIVDLQTDSEAEKVQPSTGYCGVLKHDCQKCVQTTAVVIQSEWSAITSLEDETRMLFHNLLDTVYKKNEPLPESVNRCSQYTQSIYKNIGRNYVNKTYKLLRSRKDRATTNTSSIKSQLKLAHISDRVKYDGFYQLPFDVHFTLKVVANICVCWTEQKVLHRDG